mgnify:CR=1 FL=1
MKKLETLVPDIYAQLDQLSLGEKLNISTEELDLTAANLREAIEHWTTPQNRNEFSLRMSNIGKPLRQLWYDSRSTATQHPHSASTQIKFLYGHICEQLVLMLARVAGHSVTDEQATVEVDGIKGHMDSRIDGEVVDVKTASSFAFKKFTKETLPENDNYGYLTQLSGYEASGDTENGGFFVMNKESGELCLYIPDDMDKPHIETKIKQVRDALSLDTPPDLCYNPVPQGVKGNMKIASGCKWCAHKFECFRDSNDGDGLRTFRYSNGYEYFTEVEVLPKVDEVL